MYTCTCEHPHTPDCDMSDTALDLHLQLDTEREEKALLMAKLEEVQVHALHTAWQTNTSCVVAQAFWQYTCTCMLL